MFYYQEITLIQQPEISIFFIWIRFYTQLHLAFVEHKDTQEKIPFGVSFPQYHIDKDNKKAFLGLKIRVFAHTEQELQQLDLNRWCRRLSDYVHISTPREVPQKKVTKYAHYFRCHPKINLKDRIARQATRHHVSLREAKDYFADYKEEPECYLPFIKIKSLSHDTQFRLYIGKNTVTEANDGLFSTYGLSHTSTVPEF